MPNLQIAYNFVVEKCEAENVRYSQNNRKGVIENGLQYYDCSSLMSAALTAGGFFSANPWFTTANEPSMLTAAGFTLMPDVTAAWLPGDILWRRSGTKGHTEMVYKGRVTMGAHNSSLAAEKQVSINSTATNPSSWMRLYRYIPGSVTPGLIDTPPSDYVIAALLGNFWRESHVNPGCWEFPHDRTRGGYGLAQWTSHRVQLLEYLPRNGYALTDGYGQLAYLLEEPGDWISVGGIPTFEAFLHSTSTDIKYLTEQFMRCWERPGVPALEERQAYAREIYNYIQAHKTEAVPDSWIVSDDLISREQSYNNAMMIYWWFHNAAGYAPGGGEGISGYHAAGAAREIYRRLTLHW